MKRTITITSDGSHTISVQFPDNEESYHSMFGALAESTFIFIRNGLLYYLSKHSENKSVSILEAGLGTGLNLLLTAAEAIKNPEIQFDYVALELYPLMENELKYLNYTTILNNPQLTEIFTTIHASPWNQPVRILHNMMYKKLNADIAGIPSNSEIGFGFDIVYFDAFSPKTQPELWDIDIFSGIRKKMSVNGILVTYSSKGSVKAALREAGFNVERLKGPQGKRHITRAHCNTINL